MFDQQQLDMDLPRPTPRMPNPATREGIALRMMLTDGGVDSDGFHARTGSHRLPAYIQELEALGWAIESWGVKRPLPDCPNRHLSWYRIDFSKINLPADALGVAA